MALDTGLDVLLVVTGSLQLGAIATRIAGRKRAALAMAEANAALALALTLLDVVVLMRSTEKMELAQAVILALAVAAAVAPIMGLAKRRESGWLFWPVWLWNFVMVYVLIKLRFFLHVYF